MYKPWFNHVHMRIMWPHNVLVYTDAIATTIWIKFRKWNIAIKS